MAPERVGREWETVLEKGRTRILIAVAAGCLVVAAVVGVAIVAGGGSSSSGAASTFDSFDQPDGTLAGTTTPEGFVWEVPDGQFTFDAGQVRASRDTASLAFLDTGVVPERIDVEFGGIENGSGVAFWYRDPSNYWAVVAAGDFGTWNLVRVTDGTSRFMDNTGVGLRPDSSLEIRLEGPSIRVSVNGQERIALVDGTLQQAVGAGLLASEGETGQTAWLSFGLLGS